MRQRAAYVQGVSNGDAAIIKLSGFDVRKPGQPIGQLERPTKLVMVPSKVSNSVSMRWQPVFGADTYQVFISRTGSPFAWEPAGFTNKARFSKEGIERGTVLWLAVLAIGTAGPISLSEPLEAMLLLKSAQRTMRTPRPKGWGVRAFKQFQTLCP